MNRDPKAVIENFRFAILSDIWLYNYILLYYIILY